MDGRCRAADVQLYVMLRVRQHADTQLIVNAEHLNFQSRLMIMMIMINDDDDDDDVICYKSAFKRKQKPAQSSTRRQVSK